MPKRKAISKKDRFKVFKRDSFSCQYCGKSPPQVILELDHINPVSNGGDNSLDNLICSCFDCNRGKGSDLLTSIPPTLIEKSIALQEKQDQLDAYGKLLSSIGRKKKREVKKIEAIFQKTFPSRCFTESFNISIKQFLEKLPCVVLEEAMEKSCSVISDSTPATKYFCGIAWNKIRELDNA